MFQAIRTINYGGGWKRLDGGPERATEQQARQDFKTMGVQSHAFDAKPEQGDMLRNWSDGSTSTFSVQQLED
jgi:hypothetical protein